MPRVGPAAACAIAYLKANLCSLSKFANRAVFTSAKLLTDRLMTAFEYPEWITKQGNDSDIVISSRARLARSLIGYPFPEIASEEQLEQISGEVCRAAGAMYQRYPGLRIIRTSDLTTEQLDFLVDTRIVSPDYQWSGVGRSVLLDSCGKLSIMINEEDHLRIQVLGPGLDINGIWDEVDAVDDLLAQSLHYGYSENLGYLTRNVSNVGTGLRLSVMMHLAGLRMLGSLATHIKAAVSLGVSVRGMHGEGTRPLGDLFQVSNEFTLGMAEIELVDKVDSAAQYLLQEERQARKEILLEPGNHVVDTVSSALNALQSSQQLSLEKAMQLLSAVRFGFESQLIGNCSRSSLNIMLTLMMSMYGNGFTAGTIRARALRDSLRGAGMIKNK